MALVDFISYYHFFFFLEELINKVNQKKSLEIDP